MRSAGASRNTRYVGSVGRATRRASNAGRLIHWRRFTRLRGVQRGRPPRLPRQKERTLPPERVLRETCSCVERAAFTGAATRGCRSTCPGGLRTPDSSCANCSWERNCEVSSSVASITGTSWTLLYHVIGSFLSIHLLKATTFLRLAAPPWRPREAGHGRAIERPGRADAAPAGAQGALTGPMDRCIFTAVVRGRCRRNKGSSRKRRCDFGFSPRRSATENPDNSRTL